MNFFTFTKLGRTLLLAVGVVVSVVCVSYSDNPPELVGQWVNVINCINIELFKDGTGVVGNTSITWKTEGKRFVFTQNNNTTVRDYNLSGYELTRTFDDGSVAVWVRKDKVEEYKEKNSIEFTDSRNGQKYRAVKIGDKTWMAQNLNYQTGNSWCYGDDNSNCEKYGRLYDWYSAKLKACPAGWHLPSNEEWNGLIKAVTSIALKSASGWDSNGNGIDCSGFSALPGGIRYSSGRFDDVGKEGLWWTATRVGNCTYGRKMFYDKGYVDEGCPIADHGISVRCVQD